MSVYVGIDVTASALRWRWSMRAARSSSTVTCPPGVKPVLSVLGGLPAGTPAAYEAAFGWGWLLELLEGYGFEPHMVHPLQGKAIASARLKNDKVDAATLAQLLRADLLPEAWIAPPQGRQLRALPRHRAQLVRLRNRIHAILANHGHGRPWPRPAVATAGRLLAGELWQSGISRNEPYAPSVADGQHVKKV
jgi:transposase